MSPKNDHKIQNASSDKNGGKRCKCVGVQDYLQSPVISNYFAAFLFFYFSLLESFCHPLKIVTRQLPTLKSSGLFSHFSLFYWFVLYNVINI